MGRAWQRVTETVALTIPISMIMIRGGFRDTNVPVWVMLGAVAVIAITVYRMWPGLDIVLEGRVPFEFTWIRIAGLVGVGILLTFAIVAGGTWFGFDFDPWIVFALLALAAMRLLVSDWEDTTIHWRSPG